MKYFFLAMLLAIQPVLAAYPECTQFDCAKGPAGGSCTKCCPTPFVNCYAACGTRVAICGAQGNKEKLDNLIKKCLNFSCGKPRSHCNSCCQSNPVCIFDCINKMNSCP